MIRPNRSNRLNDWCEINPCLLSSARMSSMILFSVSANKYGSGKAVSGILAWGFLRRKSEMMSYRSCFEQRPLSFEYFHDGRDLPHVRDGRFFDKHRVTLGTVVAHEVFSPDSCASRVTQCCTRLCVGFPTTTISGHRGLLWISDSRRE